MNVNAAHAIVMSTHNPVSAKYKGTIILKASHLYTNVWVRVTINSVFPGYS